MAQPRLHNVQIEVMPEPGLQRHLRGPWLVRIELPRMEVEYKRPTIALVHLFDSQFAQRIRPKPKIAATRARNIAAQYGNA